MTLQELGWEPGQVDLVVHGQLRTAPTMRRTYGSAVFRPTDVRLRYRRVLFGAWQPIQISVSGPRVRKDGSDAQTSSSESFYLGTDGTDRHCPEWLVQLARTVGGDWSDGGN